MLIYTSPRICKELAIKEKPYTVVYVLDCATSYCECQSYRLIPILFILIYILMYFVPIKILIPNAILKLRLSFEPMPAATPGVPWTEVPEILKWL